MITKFFIRLKFYPTLKVTIGFKLFNIGICFETAELTISTAPLDISVKAVLIGIQSYKLDQSWAAFYKRGSSIGIGILSMTWYV